MDSLQDGAADVESLALLSRFRLDFHACLTARTDELCELADAVLCAGGPVRSLAGLSLAAEHQRGHGALYDAVNHGRIDVTRLRGPPTTRPCQQPLETVKRHLARPGGVRCPAARCPGRLVQRSSRGSFSEAPLLTTQP